MAVSWKKQKFIKKIVYEILKLAPNLFLTSPFDKNEEILKNRPRHRDTP